MRTHCNGGRAMGTILRDWLDENQWAVDSWQWPDVAGRGSGKSYNWDSPTGGSERIMPEMTIAPVATHGFFVDGRWQEDGDLVEIRAPYDSSLIARVVQGRREHAE